MFLRREKAETSTSPHKQAQKSIASPTPTRQPAWTQSLDTKPGSCGCSPAKVPNAPVNDFEDCPAAWQKKANAALAIARPWVSNVIVGLSNLPNPIPAPVSALLNRHFHTVDRGNIRKIVGHYNDIAAALNSPIDFECETECDKDVAAYVYNIWTDVHLCPVWHSQTPRKQANTIIHELAHDAAGRDDEAYVWQPKYAKLSAEDAIDNADSYSSFAEEAN